MRALVIGSGPVGSFLAASLRRAGADVTLHGRGASFETLRTQQAVRIAPRDRPGDVDAVDLRMSASPPAAAGWELVVFATKAQALGDAAERFARHVQDAAVLLPQNGLPWWQFLGTPAPAMRLESLDPGGRIERSMALANIAGGVVTKGLAFRDDGVLLEARVPASDRFVLGDVVHGSGAAELPSKWLLRADLPVVTTTDIRAEKWKKLLINVAFNPLGALSHLGFGEVLDIAEGERLVRSLMEEAMAVARSTGFDGNLDSAQALDRARASRDHKTSMLQDVEAGRAPEIAPILGALLELARRRGLATPTLETTHACLRLVELALKKGPIRQVPHPQPSSQG